MTPVVDLAVLMGADALDTGGKPLLWCDRYGGFEGPMKVLLLVGLVIAIWLVHRLALWLESRGWLYYRHRSPSSSALGTAFLEVQQLVDPGKRLVLEATREDRSGREESGDPPDKAS